MNTFLGCIQALLENTFLTESLTTVDGLLLDYDDQHGRPNSSGCLSVHSVRVLSSVNSFITRIAWSPTDASEIVQTFGRPPSPASVGFVYDVSGQ